MSDYVISCCSTADLSAEHFEERNINYVCFKYELDGVSHYDDLGKTSLLTSFTGYGRRSGNKDITG